MSEDEIRDHAERILLYLIDYVDIMTVIEDYELEKACGDDIESIYEAMITAQVEVTVTWER